MAWALGAPVEYKGRDLRTAHAQLVRERGLSDRHFDAVAGHLGATLRELGLGDELVEGARATRRACGHVATRRRFPSCSRLRASGTTKTQVVLSRCFR